MRPHFQGNVSSSTGALPNRTYLSSDGFENNLPITAQVEFLHHLWSTPLRQRSALSSTKEKMITDTRCCSSLEQLSCRMLTASTGREKFNRPSQQSVEFQAWHWYFYDWSCPQINSQAAQRMLGANNTTNIGPCKRFVYPLRKFLRSQHPQSARASNSSYSLAPTSTSVRRPVPSALTGWPGFQDSKYELYFFLKKIKFSASSSTYYYQ